MSEKKLTGKPPEGSLKPFLLRQQRPDTPLPIPPRQDDCNAEIDVGGCIRRLREGAGLSIRALAEKSGLAVNTLSLIEHGKTSPSVSTLQQLARALHVHITAFFETGASARSLVYTRAKEGPCAIFDHGTVEDLGAGLSDRSLETFVVTLEPHAGSGADPIVHSGLEFVYCLEGRIAYVVADQTYVLESGDSLIFESHLPHRWHNMEATRSKALLILHPSDERDRGHELHIMLGELVDYN